MLDLAIIDFKNDNLHIHLNINIKISKGLAWIQNENEQWKELTLHADLATFEEIWQESTAMFKKPIQEIEIAGDTRKNSIFVNSTLQDINYINCLDITNKENYKTESRTETLSLQSLCSLLCDMQ